MLCADFVTFCFLFVQLLIVSMLLLVPMIYGKRYQCQSVCACVCVCVFDSFYVFVCGRFQFFPVQ